MESRQFSAQSLEHLQADGFDLMAQVEAFTRYVREIQQDAARLKEEPTPAQRRVLVARIRAQVSALIRDCEPFCATAEELRAVADSISPERRKSVRSAANDRRRA